MDTTFDTTAPADLTAEEKLDRVLALIQQMGVDPRAVPASAAPAVPATPEMPAPRPHRPHPHHERAERVRLDAGQLSDALDRKGIGHAARYFERVPSEVKIAAALALGVGVEFADVEAMPAPLDVDFENSLLADERIATIARRLGVERDRLAAELEPAPPEMVALVLLVCDATER